MPKQSKYTPDITARFLLLMDEVIQAGACKNRMEFCARIGEYHTNLTKMERGTRAPTLDQCAAACLEFGYAANWMLLNIGSKKLDKSQNIPIEKRVHDLELKMRTLQRQSQQLSALQNGISKKVSSKQKTGA